jgi:hypothetical protein
LRADAAESAVCGYLALIALAGLVVNALWKVSWADPIAALALLSLILREGREAWKGKPAAIEVPELLPDDCKPGTIRFVPSD